MATNTHYNAHCNLIYVVNLIRLDLVQGVSLLGAVKLKRGRGRKTPILSRINLPMVCLFLFNKKFNTTSQQDSSLVNKSVNIVRNIFRYSPHTHFQNYHDVICISILLNLLDLETTRLDIPSKEIITPGTIISFEKNSLGQFLQEDTSTKSFLTS